MFEPSHASCAEISLLFRRKRKYSFAPRDLFSLAKKPRLCPLRSRNGPGLDSVFYGFCTGFNCRKIQLRHSLQGKIGATKKGTQTHSTSYHKRCPLSTFQGFWPKKKLNNPMNNPMRKIEPFAAGNCIRKRKKRKQPGRSRVE